VEHDDPAEVRRLLAGVPFTPEQLAQAVGLAERRRLEHVQLGILCKERVDLLLVAAVKSVEQLGHLSSS